MSGGVQSRQERYYASWFREMRCRSTLRLVEIGASQASLKAWDRMFQSSSKTILGVADSDRSSENAMDAWTEKGLSENLTTIHFFYRLERGFSAFKVAHIDWGSNFQTNPSPVLDWFPLLVRW